MDATNRSWLKAGGRAGNMLSTRMPDAIILDLFMPDMDGFTILEKLRNDPAYAISRYWW
jgi:CheY-like chemotaxis protein